MVELTNGCICCTLREDLLTTLAALAADERGFEYVVVESSGISEVGRAHGAPTHHEDVTRMFLSPHQPFVSHSRAVGHLNGRDEMAVCVASRQTQNYSWKPPRGHASSKHSLRAAAVCCIMMDCLPRDHL